MLDLYLRNHGMCGICDLPVEPAEADIDHVIPITRGGLDEPSNRQLAHARCNRWKYNRLQEELLGSRSLLDLLRIDFRITPELKRRVLHAAVDADLGIGAWITQAIEEKLARDGA